MSECPECGADVPGDGKFCPACGTDIAYARGDDRDGRSDGQKESSPRESLDEREPRVPSSEELSEERPDEQSDQRLRKPKPWNQQEGPPQNQYDESPPRDQSSQPPRGHSPQDRYDQPPRNQLPGDPSEDPRGYPPVLPHPADHKLLLAGVVIISAIGLLEGSVQAIAPELIIEAAVEEGFIEEGELPEGIILATGVFGAIISFATLGLTAYYYRERRLPRRYFWALVGAGAGGFLFAQSLFLALFVLFGIYGLVKVTYTGRRND